ncbi:zinc-dependent metalloprotease [Streptomyces sp. NPDC056672]|uniref:zinc-dependent metalloprotease n=1 Tax=Streptomyces sp. NPDC056672 TaxID=3345906 RepID=UPI00367399ED
MQQTADVRHEAKRKYKPFARRIEEIVEETAPVVEAVTELPLPGVVVRLLKAEKWIKEHTVLDRQRLDAEKKELDPGPLEVQAARAQIKAVRKAIGVSWILTGGQAVETSLGQPQLLVMPETLQHAGRLDDPDVLCALVSHELTHLAQHRASGGSIFTLRQTFFPHLRGIEGRDYAFLMEGHATWAAQEVTRKLRGREVPLGETSDKASWVFKRVVAKLPDRRRTLEVYEEAGHVVERAVGALGATRFNRLWQDPDLVPTERETSRPDAWIERLR